MRISDWSSDVCSSDLARLGGRAGEGDVAEAGDAHHGLRLAAARQHQARQLRKAAGHQGSARVVAQATAGDDAAGSGQDVLYRAGDLGAHRIVGEVGAEAARSEEHTSELPTLMRSSSPAVPLQKQ